MVEPLRLESSSTYTSTPSAQSTTNQPSLLHRTLASTIVQLFVLFQLILPHLKYFLRSAYQYDRRHKISERILSGSLETVDNLGKRGLSASEALLGMCGGKAGLAISRVAGWFVAGVAGGVHEGLGKGMVIIGAMGQASEGRRVDGV